jgi:hypothetical protein
MTPMVMGCSPQPRLAGKQLNEWGGGQDRGGKGRKEKRKNGNKKQKRKKRSINKHHCAYCASLATFVSWRVFSKTFSLKRPKRKISRPRSVFQCWALSCWLASLCCLPLERFLWQR